jgi:hypothetical protein
MQVDGYSKKSGSTTVLDVVLAWKKSVYQYGIREYLMSTACFIICCASHENDAGSWSLQNNRNYIFESEGEVFSIERKLE